MPEEPLKDETVEWLERAERDFDDARFNIEDGRVDTGLFLLQQSLEKSLKAYLIDEEGNYPFSHNLVHLSSKAGILGEEKDYLSRLTSIYQVTRYPDETEVEVQNPEDMLDRGGELIEWIKKELKGREGK